MGLIKSLWNRIRGASDELAEQISDAEVDGKLAIKDSKAQIAEFTTKIAKLVALNKQTERKLTEAKADVEKFTKMATRAADAGNEDDLRQLLEKKGTSQKLVDNYTAEITRNDKLEKQLKDNLATARKKIDSAENNLTSLSARKEGAEVRKELAKANSSMLGDGGGLGALDDFEKKVNAQEAEAEAIEEMVDEEPGNVDKGLEDKYSGSNSDVDDEMAKMLAAAKKKGAKKTTSK